MRTPLNAHEGMPLRENFLPSINSALPSAASVHEAVMHAGASATNFWKESHLMSYVVLKDVWGVQLSFQKCQNLVVLKVKGSSSKELGGISHIRLPSALLSSLCSFVHRVISRAIKMHLLCFVVTTYLCSGMELFWFYIFVNFGLVTKRMVCSTLLILLLCSSCGVWVLFNNFTAMDKRWRRGVPWCIGYQFEGSANYIDFALQAGVPHRRSTTMSFRYVSLYRSVPLVCSMYRLC